MSDDFSDLPEGTVLRVDPKGPDRDAWAHRGVCSDSGTIDIMRVTIQLPDDISAALEEQWDDVPRRSLEAIAVEAYRTGALTDSQVQLLGLESRVQVHALLKEHHVTLQYTAADLEDDLRAQRELGILPSR